MPDFQPPHPSWPKVFLGAAVMVAIVVAVGYVCIWAVASVAA